MGRGLGSLKVLSLPLLLKSSEAEEELGHSGDTYFGLDLRYRIRGLSLTRGFVKHRMTCLLRLYAMGGPSSTEWEFLQWLLLRPPPLFAHAKCPHIRMCCVLQCFGGSTHNFETSRSKNLLHEIQVVAAPPKELSSRSCK